MVDIQEARERRGARREAGRLVGAALDSDVAQALPRHAPLQKVAESAREVDCEDVARLAHGGRERAQHEASSCAHVDAARAGAQSVLLHHGDQRRRILGDVACLAVLEAAGAALLPAGE